VDDDTLATLEHENMASALSQVGAAVDGALVRGERDVLIISTGLPVRLFNQVLVTGPAATEDGIRAAVEEMRARTEHFVLNLRVGSDDRFRGTADELGLAPVSATPWMPGMAAWPLQDMATVPVPARHEIRRVTDAAGVADHVAAGAEGFGMPVEWLDTIMTTVLDEPAARVYVGYTDGVPVTTGLGMVTGRTIGVYNISTVPAARRRGYGAAMTMRIVDDAAAEGCDVATLQASDMGKPTYERLGFRTVVEYVGYTDPTTLEDA
jgi:GNAT superfamily N-acetyltransferase